MLHVLDLCTPAEITRLQFLLFVHSIFAPGINVTVSPEDSYFLASQQKFYPGWFTICSQTTLFEDGLPITLQLWSLNSWLSQSVFKSLDLIRFKHIAWAVFFPMQIPGSHWIGVTNSNWQCSITPAGCKCFPGCFEAQKACIKFQKLSSPHANLNFKEIHCSVQHFLSTLPKMLELVKHSCYVKSPHVMHN